MLRSHLRWLMLAADLVDRTQKAMRQRRETNRSAGDWQEELRLKDLGVEMHAAIRRGHALVEREEADNERRPGVDSAPP